MRCLVRFLLILVSLVYLFVGIVFAVFGSVAGSTIFNPWTPDELTILALVILVLGVVVLVIGILGMVTSCSRSYSISYCFSFLVFFTIIFQVIGAVLFIFFRFELENVLVESFTQTMNWYRGAADRDSPFLSACGEFWDLIQNGMGCCGVQDWADWKETPYGQSSNIPSSCCFNETSSCNSSLNWASIPSSISSLAVASTPASSLSLDLVSTLASIHKEGCLSLLGEAVQVHLIPLACSAAGLLALQVLGVCFACCLARAVQVEDYAIN